MFLRKGSQPQNINKGNKMTAFLRAVKFIFNFCASEVSRGVFGVSPPFPPSIPHGGQERLELWWCPGPGRPPPLSATSRGAFITRGPGLAQISCHQHCRYAHSKTWWPGLYTPQGSTYLRYSPHLPTLTIFSWAPRSWRRGTDPGTPGKHSCAIPPGGQEGAGS